MSKLTRREFCVLTGCGLAVGACGSGAGGGDGGTGKDLAVPADMALPHDMAGCPENNKINVGPSAKLTVGGTPVYIGCSHIFVIRDAGGIYAVSAVCTHEGCDVFYATATKDFECPCHQSTFDLNGAVTMAPATVPLPHFACSLTGQSEVIVDLATQVPANTRLVA